MVDHWRPPLHCLLSPSELRTLLGYASSSVLLGSALRNLKQMEEERKLCWWDNGCVFAFFVIYPLVTPASSFFRLFLPRMQRTLFVVKTGMGLSHGGE